MAYDRLSYEVLASNGTLAEMNTRQRETIERLNAYITHMQGMERTLRAQVEAKDLGWSQSQDECKALRTLVETLETYNKNQVALIDQREATIVKLENRIESLENACRKWQALHDESKDERALKILKQAHPTVEIEP